MARSSEVPKQYRQYISEKFEQYYGNDEKYKSSNLTFAQREQLVKKYENQTFMDSLYDE